MELDRRQLLALGAAGLLGWHGVDAGHVAMYAYTRGSDLVRARHRAVVNKAIRQRSQALECGWRNLRGKPVLELGPVRNAAHWKRVDHKVQSVWAAWPFAVVLEFSREGNPNAWIDWFRRRRGSTDGAGWFLDPAGFYVEHMNAAVTCDADDRYAYMAVVDTPTGDVMGSNEFVARGRVVRDGVGEQRRGWWFRFRTPRAERTVDWVEELWPLVPWRIGRRTRKNGALGSVELEPDELSVPGTDKVFRFPKIPAGMRPCRGD